MRCTNCGYEIPDGELYCKRCGREIRIVPDYNPLEDVYKRQPPDRRPAFTLS